MKMRPFSQIALLMIPAAFAAAQEPPTLRLGSHEITISGLAPGSDVAVMGAARSYMRGVHNRWDFAEQLVDGDLDGQVTWRQENSALPFAVWVAVDLSTGRYAQAAGARPADRILPYSKNSQLKSLQRRREIGQLREQSLPMARKYS